MLRHLITGLVIGILGIMTIIVSAPAYALDWNQISAFGKTKVDVITLVGLD